MPNENSPPKSVRAVKDVSPKLKMVLVRFPASFESSFRACCLHCSSPLVLHQPDAEAPARLLGVCEQCKHWFLIDLLPDLSEGIMVRLPDTEVIRDLSRENPAAGISLMSHEPDLEPIDEPSPSS
jgi:hypothetical protein